MRGGPSLTSIDAIAEITGIIDTINDIQTTIAAAVEEQTATTGEISNTIATVADTSNDIATRIGAVATALPPSPAKRRRGLRTQLRRGFGGPAITASTPASHSPPRRSRPRTCPIS